MNELFAPYALGPSTLANRIAMAPMTRCRADNPGLAPTPTMAEYYRQRAGAGLIISEGVPTSEQARGYINTPGLYSEAQIAGWRLVTEAVHAAGGKIFAQLWHCGRISHASLRADRSPPVGASSATAQTITFVPDASGQPEQQPCDTPRALTTAEAAGIAGEFAAAARKAIAAGFDGVEIHGANGYLFDQFRCPFLNRRDDVYGGSRENRRRLLLETTASVAAAIGAERVGVRLSPLGQANDMQPDPEPAATYGELVGALSAIGIVYLHIYEQSGSWIHDPENPLLRLIRASFAGTLMLCGGFDRDKGEAALAAGSGDLIAIGKAFIANPDLVSRMRARHPLARFDSASFYAGQEKGYIDYPVFAG